VVCASLLSLGLLIVNSVIGRCMALARQILHGGDSIASFGSYISCADTVRAAKAARLSVVDYVERLWEQRGQTKQVITNIFEVAPATTIRRACEIGPGTGRYMDCVLRDHFESESSDYEIYEIASDWAKWLTAEYKVTRRSADGRTLSQTDSNSMDLVHAHGVFVYTPFLTTCRYLQEFRRVIRTGGLIAFDIYNEDCFPTDVLARWLNSGHEYPTLFSEKIADQILMGSGCRKIKEFSNKHGMGFSKYLIYQAI
jgi:hypothetical protein